MAEVTGMRNNALPYPVYGVAFYITFPLLDADGDPVSPSSPDSERSLNGDTFADCTNEATEIATSSGICYLLLTAAEMTADIVTVRIQSTGAKTTVMTLYPRKLVVVRTGTCQGANDTGDIQLDSSASAVDDYYNGCLCVAVIDSTTEARIINDYVGSTKVGEVSPAWNTAAPDNNDTFTIYAVPENSGVAMADAVSWLGTTIAAADTAGYPKVTIKDGTGTGELDTASGLVQADVRQWLGQAVAAVTVNGVPEVDVTHFGGTAGTFASGVPAVNATQISGDSTAADNLENTFDDTAGANRWTQIIDQGTAQAVTGTTIRLRSAAAFADDELNGCWVLITGGTLGVGQVRQITDYASATDQATVDTWTTTPTGTITYQVLPGAMLMADVMKWNNTAVAAPHTAGYPAVTVKDGTGTGEIDTTSGGVLVAAMANNSITAAAIATDAIDADALATDAITEIWNKAMSDLAAVPAANASVLAGINWMFELARNKLTQTATTGTIFKDDASTSLATTTVSDDLTTFTRGEWA